MHAVSHTVGKVGRKEGVVSYRNKVPVSLFSVRQQPGEEVDAPSLSPFACPPPTKPTKGYPLHISQQSAV